MVDVPNTGTTKKGSSGRSGIERALLALATAGEVFGKGLAGQQMNSQIAAHILEQNERIRSEGDLDSAFNAFKASNPDSPMTLDGFKGAVTTGTLGTIQQGSVRLVKEKKAELLAQAGSLGSSGKAFADMTPQEQALTEGSHVQRLAFESGREQHQAAVARETDRFQNFLNNARSERRSAVAAGDAPGVANTYAGAPAFAESLPNTSDVFMKQYTFDQNEGMAEAEDQRLANSFDEGQFPEELRTGRPSFQVQGGIRTDASRKRFDVAIQDGLSIAPAIDASSLEEGQDKNDLLLLQETKTGPLSLDQMHAAVRISKKGDTLRILAGAGEDKKKKTILGNDIRNSATQLAGLLPIGPRMRFHQISISDPAAGSDPEIAFSEAKGFLTNELEFNPLSFTLEQLTGIQSVFPQDKLLTAQIRSAISLQRSMATTNQQINQAANAANIAADPLAPLSDAEKLLKSPGAFNPDDPSLAAAAPFGDAEDMLRRDSRQVTSSFQTNAPALVGEPGSFRSGSIQGEPQFQKKVTRTTTRRAPLEPRTPWEDWVGHNADLTGGMAAIDKIQGDDLLTEIQKDLARAQVDVSLATQRLQQEGEGGQEFVSDRTTQELVDAQARVNNLTTRERQIAASGGRGAVTTNVDVFLGSLFAGAQMELEPFKKNRLPGNTGDPRGMVARAVGLDPLIDAQAAKIDLGDTFDDLSSQNKIEAMWRAAIAVLNSPSATTGQTRAREIPYLRARLDFLKERADLYATATPTTAEEYAFTFADAPDIPSHIEDVASWTAYAALAQALTIKAN